MDWSDQIENMTQAWVNAQKHVWDNWYDFVQNSPTSTPFGSNMVDQWSKMAAQGLEAWTSNSNPTARAAAERMVNSQKAMMRFLEFSAGAWKDIMAKMNAGDDWQSALETYTNQIREQYTRSFESASKINQDTGLLWQLYLTQMQQVWQPFMASWQHSPNYFPAQDGFGPAWAEASQKYWDLYEQTFGKFLASPTMGSTREFEAKVRQGFDVWLKSKKAETEYQQVVAEAWVKAFEQFQKELIAISQKGEAIKTLDALSAVWTMAAERAFGEVFRSEKYVNAQANYLNSNMAVRIQQREMVELVLQALDIPTRSEVDQAHRRNHELRKEVKALKKALGHIQTAADQQDSAASDLKKTQATIKSLEQEVTQLKKAVAQAQAAADASAALEQTNNNLGSLQSEVESLKKQLAAVAKPAPAKRTTRKKTSTAAAKTAEPAESKEGES